MIVVNIEHCKNVGVAMCMDKDLEPHPPLILQSSIVEVVISISSFKRCPIFWIVVNFCHSLRIHNYYGNDQVPKIAVFCFKVYPMGLHILKELLPMPIL